MIKNGMDGQHKMS